jgi:hypothetical protein
VDVDAAKDYQPDTQPNAQSAEQTSYDNEAIFVTIFAYEH